MPLNQQVTINVSNEVVGISVNIIHIPEDTLKLTLNDQVEKIRKSKDWGDIIGALGLLVTSLAALVSSYNANSAIPRQVYDLVFWVGLIGGILDFVNCIHNHHRKPITVDDVMSEINKRVSDCSCQVKNVAFKPPREKQQALPGKNNNPTKKKRKW